MPPPALQCPPSRRHCHEPLIGKDRQSWGWSGWGWGGKIAFWSGGGGEWIKTMRTNAGDVMSLNCAGFSGKQWRQLYVFCFISSSRGSSGAQSARPGRPHVIDAHSSFHRWRAQSVGDPPLPARQAGTRRLLAVQRRRRDEVCRQHSSSSSRFDAAGRQFSGTELTAKRTTKQWPKYFGERRHRSFA